MGIVRLMAKGAAHDLAETHPQLRSLRSRLVEKYNLHPERARRLVVSLIEHVANDLGDSYLGEMTARLRKIDTIRGRIAGAIDHVVAEGTLPAELSKEALTGLFDDLEKEMAELHSVSNFSKGYEPKVSFKPQDPKFDAGPFGTSSDPLQGHVASTPTAPLRDAMTAMESASPARAKVFREVLDRHGDELAQAVLATTETTQGSALKRRRRSVPISRRTNWRRSLRR
jgi:polyhydroxyalkanoate synthesis regulator phasin